MGDSWVRMALRESFTVCDCGLISASKARLSERCRMMRSPANRIKPWLDKCPLMFHKNWAYHTAAVVHVTQAVSRKVISPIRAEPYTTWLRLCARARLKTNEVSPQALLEPFIQKSNQHSPHERKNMACWVMSLDRTLTPIGLDDDITDEFNKALQKSGKDNIIDNLISRKKLKRMGLNCTLYQESFSDKDAYIAKDWTQLLETHSKTGQRLPQAVGVMDTVFLQCRARCESLWICIIAKKLAIDLGDREIRAWTQLNRVSEQGNINSKRNLHWQMMCTEGLRGRNWLW